MYRINIRRSIPSRPSGSVSPAVLADDSSIISAILNRGGNKRIRSYFSSDRDKAFQNLTTHESHPTAGSSVPPCNAADTCSIIICRTDSARHMSPMAVRNQSRIIIHKIITMYVIHISIAIIVHTITWYLIRIRP